MTVVKDLLFKEGVELDETGYAGVTSGGLFVNLQCDEAGESLYLYCSVAKLPDPVPQKLVREILRSGLLGLGKLRFREGQLLDQSLGLGP